jgi:hypothetical protein
MTTLKDLILSGKSLEEMGFWKPALTNAHYPTMHFFVGSSSVIGEMPTLCNRRLVPDSRIDAVRNAKECQICSNRYQAIQDARDDYCAYCGGWPDWCRTERCPILQDTNKEN